MTTVETETDPTVGIDIDSTAMIVVSANAGFDIDETAVIDMDSTVGIKIDITSEMVIGAPLINF